MSRPFRRHARAGVLAALLASHTAMASDAAAGIEARPCPEGVAAEGVACGSLSVPEDYERPDGRRIELAIAVVAAEEPRSGAVPLFPLQGGPGVPVRDMAPMFAGPLSTYRRSRSVVMVDRRGTGDSAPLHCPGLERLHPLETMYTAELVRECGDTLSRAADLTRYSSIEAARDIDEVRRAIGAEAIDLWGMSYGTQLAREYMRGFPDRVRSAVLVGAPAPGFRTPLHHAAAAQRALDLVFFECRMDPACSSAYPDLSAEWRQVLARLEAAPVTGFWPDPAGGEGRPVEIRRDVFGEAFRSMLSTTQGQRKVPHIIHRAAAGDFAPFMAEQTLPDSAPGWLAEGLYLSVVCSEETVRINPAEVKGATAGTFLGDYRIRVQMEACAHWPARELPSAFYEPARSQAPVLFLVGTLDHVTPPLRHEEISRLFPNARIVEMPHAAHVWFTWEQAAECFDSMALEFYAKGTAGSLDTSCTTRATPPPFVVP